MALVDTKRLTSTSVAAWRAFGSARDRIVDRLDPARGNSVPVGGDRELEAAPGIGVDAEFGTLQLALRR